MAVLLNCAVKPPCCNLPLIRNVVMAFILSIPPRACRFLLTNSSAVCACKSIGQTIPRIAIDKLRIEYPYLE
jgi:hypothetical protein